jgi:tetratricopeptide (TPR) repeat protein
MPQINYKYLKFQDFSQARNESFALNKDRWIWWQDVDDVVVTPAAIRDLIRKNPHISVFKAQVHSYTERNTTETILHSRLVRNMKGVYWQNRCHEDLSYSLNKLNIQHALTDMVVQHWGNIRAKDWQRKNERNLNLLEADIRESGPEDKPRLAMLYYGVVNCYIIKASQEGPKRKAQTLVKALKTCDECIELLTNQDPLMAKMWMMRGLVCMDAGEHLAAKQSFHKAYDEWKQPEAAVNLAEIYLREKNFDKVVEILKPLENAEGAYPIRNMSYDPVQLHSLLLEKLGHAWANKAQASKDNFDEYIRKAESYYRKSLDFRPSVVISDLMLQILFNTKRFDEAGFLAIKSVNTWPRFWKAWWYLSQYEMLNNRKATAKLFLQECLRLNPKVKEARHNLEMLDKTRRNKAPR